MMNSEGFWRVQVITYVYEYKYNKRVSEICKGELERGKKSVAINHIKALAPGIYFHRTKRY